MNSSASALLKEIPDFTDLLVLAQDIKNTAVSKLKIEVEIQRLESNVFSTVILDPAYQINGKPPAITFIKEAYKFGGIQEEIIPLREELVEIVTELDMLKQRFRIFEQMLDIWRTLSANERSASL